MSDSFAAGSIPPNQSDAHDLSAEQAQQLNTRLQAARNPEELRQLADEIVSLTGFGVTQVLSLEGFGHSFALSGLSRAGALAHAIEQKGAQLGPHHAHESHYHGYRDALYSDQD